MNMRSIIALITCILAVLTTSACTTTRTSDQVLADLCTQQDLSQTRQQVVLAGGYHALARHDLVCAERLTLDARAKDLKDPYAALNLGAIYQRTGRIALAQEMYALVIGLENTRDNSRESQSHLATRDEQVHKKPADIARHNLALLKR